MRRTPARAAAVTIGGLALVVGPLTAPASAVEHEIQLIGINDFHGRLTASVGDDGTETGGAKQLAGAVAELSGSFTGDTYFLSAGDNIGASTFTSAVQEDEPTIEVLNEMGLTVSAVGNHEFDKGFADIEPGGRVDVLADFPYLGANVYADGTQDPVLQEYFVPEVPDGDVRIGFIGTVTAETASLVTPAGIADIDFGDEAEAVNRVAAQLRDGDEANGEADVVVALAHSGSSDPDCAAVAASDVPAGASADVDVIFQGHTHQAYACADVTGAGGFTGPVVQGGQYGESFDRVTLTYDDVAGEVTASTAEVLEVVGYDQALNTEVAATVDAAVAFAQEAGSVPLGSTTTDILRGAEGDRGVESVLGNFIADVQLDQTRDAGAQIAFMNPGGLRADFLVGDQFGTEECGVITLGEANAVQPFANALVTVTMTGAQIKAALEQQWQPAGADRPFLALGVSAGFAFEYNERAAEGSRIVSITLDGEQVSPTDTYRVTVNEFLASGGDNFAAFAEGEDPQQLGASDLEALTAYLADNSPVTPDVEPRRAPAYGEAEPLNVSGAVCPAAPAPTPTPAPTPGPGAGGGSGQNPGLSVDTGVTAGPDAQPWVAAGLLALLALAAAAVRRRRGAVR